MCSVCFVCFSYWSLSPLTRTGVPVVWGCVRALNFVHYVRCVKNFYARRLRTLQIMYYILDKILKFLTYYTPFHHQSLQNYLISKTVWFFWPTLYNGPLLCDFSVPIKGLTFNQLTLTCRSTVLPTWVSWTAVRSQKLEYLGYLAVKTAWPYVHLFRLDTSLWQANGQSQLRRAMHSCALCIAVLCRASKTKTENSCYLVACY